MCIEISIQFNLPFLEPNQKADKQQLCNFPEGLANVRFRVEFILRVIIGDIELFFFTHEYNTMETRGCPIVVGRQHDYVKPSHCRRVAIESKKFTAR